MSQRDYILRIAEEFGRALAQVLYNKQIQDYAAAHKLIDEQCKDEILLSMFTSFDSLDTEKCWLLATLLKVEGDIYQDQGNTSESYYSYVRSLNLVLEVLLLDTTLSGTTTIPELEELLSRLSEEEK